MADQQHPDVSGELLLVPYGNGDWSLDFFIGEKHPDFSGTHGGVVSQEQPIKLLALLQVKAEIIEEIVAIDFEHDQLHLFEIKVGPISAWILLRSHLIKHRHPPVKANQNIGFLLRPSLGISVEPNIISLTRHSRGTISGGFCERGGGLAFPLTMWNHLKKKSC